MTDEDNVEDLDSLLLGQMRQDFLLESQDNLDQFNLKLTHLEQDPGSEDVINELFRIAHTLKGTASFVGLNQITDVAHKMEDVFGVIRKGERSVTPEIIDVMFEALQVLKVLRDKAASDDTTEIDSDGLSKKLASLLSEGTPEPEQAPSPSSSHEKDAADSAAQAAQTDAVSQAVADKGGVESRTSSKAGFFAESIRVPTARLDALMNLVGEAITRRNQLNNLAAQMGDDELLDVASAIDRLTSQIHGNLLGTRMVPIEKLYIKFPGVVRNMAREMGKEVELVLRGKEIELDKNIIEQIYDPLVHLLRNAIDHGIETAQQRQQQGKPGVGRISIAASHQQNMVVIDVSDDGHGMDARRIKQLAVEKGVITEAEAQVMDDEQAVRLIFKPGFSTAEKVSEVSGRGVGMDVVIENMKKLRGIVNIDTTVGGGASFRLQVPLTLAVLQVLLVRAGDLVYALPLHTVRETLQIAVSELKSMESNRVVFIRDKAYPLKSLQAALNAGATQPVDGRFLPVVVVEIAEKRIALSVDELLDKQEVVMKPLGEYLGNVDGIEGVTLLADGSITPIVNMESVVRGGEHHAH